MARNKLWPAAIRVPGLSFAPVRRATTAAIPMPKPQAMEYTGTISDSVKPTVAVATTPSLLTK